MVIRSTTNEKVKTMRTLQTKKGRKQQGCMLLEGNKLLKEAIEAGYQARTIFVQEDAGNLYEQYIDFPETLLVSRSVIEAVCEVNTPQKIVAAVEFKEEVTNLSYDGQVYLALDQIQDPGNMGAILRCADAFGVSGVVIGAGCADLYAPKCLRSAMGSTFHLKVDFVESVAVALEEAKKNDLFVLVTDLRGEGEMKLSAQQKTILVIGNEGNGVSEEILQVADQRFRLPIPGRAESLNVAVCTGILLYEITQQIF